MYISWVMGTTVSVVADAISTVVEYVAPDIIIGTIGFEALS